MALTVHGSGRTAARDVDWRSGLLHSTGLAEGALRTVVADDEFTWTVPLSSNGTAYDRAVWQLRELLVKAASQVDRHADRAVLVGGVAVGSRSISSRSAVFAYQ